MKLLPLTRKGVVVYAKVDDDIYEIVKQFKWTYITSGNDKKDGEHIYGWRNKSKGARGRGKNLPQSPISLLHYFVLPKREGCQIDHISGDTLDNQRENLRYATPRENSLNKGVAHNRKMKGVSRSRGGWRAYITPDRRQIHIGVFKTPEEAMRAYDRKAIELYGEFARTNFPREEYEPLPLAA